MFHSLMRFKAGLAWVRYFLALAAVLFTIYSVQHSPKAEAQQQQGPQVWQQQNANTSQANSIFKRAIDNLQFFVIGFGMISLAGGFIAATPLIGKKEKGMEIIKGSLVVIACGVLYWAIVAFFKTVLVG